MKGTLTIKEFENKIITLFNEISPISFTEHEALINEYVDILSSLKNQSKDANKIKGSFFNKLNQLGIEYKVPTTSGFLKMTKEYESYGDCAIMWAYWTKDEKKGTIVERPFSITEREGHIFNDMIFRNIAKKDLKYLFGFSERKCQITIPLFFGEYKINGPYFEQREYAASDIVYFPEKSKFVKAHYDRSGTIGDVLVKLNK